MKKTKDHHLSYRLRDASRVSYPLPPPPPRLPLLVPSSLSLELTKPRHPGPAHRLISHDYVPSPIRAYNELMALLGRPHLRLQARGGGAAHEEKEQSTRQAERVSGSSMAHQLRESSSAASHARLV
jgi:hypothetical protein